MNHEIFWIFELGEWNVKPNSSDCRASKIIWNHTKLKIHFRFTLPRKLVRVRYHFVNDFWCFTIWAIEIQVSLTQLQNRKNPGIQAMYNFQLLRGHFPGIFPIYKPYILWYSPYDSFDLTHIICRNVKFLKLWKS